MSNQPTKFRTKNWVETNDDLRGTYNTNSQIKFKTSVLKSTFCDYSDAYIIVKETITNVRVLAPPEPDNNDKEVVIKNCAAFIDSISKANNTQIDNTKDINVVKPMYNLIEYSNNFPATSGNLWQYYRMN